MSAGAILEHGRKVGSRLPVKQSEFLELLSAKIAQATLGGIEQTLEPLPVRFSLVQPAI